MFIEMTKTVFYIIDIIIAIFAVVLSQKRNRKLIKILIFVNIVFEKIKISFQNVFSISHPSISIYNLWFYIPNHKNLLKIVNVGYRKTKI